MTNAATRREISSSLFGLNVTLSRLSFGFGAWPALWRRSSSTTSRLITLDMFALRSARTRRRARFRAPSTKPPATRHASSPQTEAYLVSRRERKKVEMLVTHRKRITACDTEVPAAPTTSSSSLPPPRTCGNWPR
jgi:hypothetical protein